MTNKLKVAGLVVFLIGVATTVFAQAVPPSPQPAVLEDLVRQIQQLLAEIQKIQQQVNELQSGAPAPTVTPAAGAPGAEVRTPAPTETPPISEIPLLRRGSRGTAVRELQQFLIDQGYLRILRPSGYFGPLTEAAFKDFQEENDLAPTGRLDAETRAAIQSLRRGITTIIPGLIQEGAGASGQIPPGLLIAPGIQGQLLTHPFGTSTPPFGTGTPPFGTGTPPFGTGTPPWISPSPSPSPSASQCSNYSGTSQCLSNPYCTWMYNSCVAQSSIGPCLSWMTNTIVLGGGCHFMNTYFDGPMTKYLLPNSPEGSWPTLCSQAWVPNCTVPGPGFTPSPSPSPTPSATSTPPTPTPSPGSGTSTPPTTPTPTPTPSGPTSFSFNAPTTASYGGYATLNWTTSGYSSCYAGVNRGDVTALGWLGVKPFSGSQSLGPLNYQNVDVQFTCIGGSSGDISSSKVITVSGGITNPWSNIGSFTVTNHPLEANACCTYLVQANVSINLSWSGSSSTGCKLNLQTPENGSTLTSLAAGLPASGSYSVPGGVSQNSKIWLTCGGVDSNRLLKVSGSAPTPSPSPSPTPTPSPSPTGNVPAAPSNLVGYLYGGYGVSVNFTWSDNSNNETGFTLYTRLAGGASWRRVTQSDFSANSTQMGITDYNVTPGTHEYKINAVNSSGSSPDSNIVSVTFTSSGFAATPTNLTATANGPSVNLNWTDNANNETEYRVYQLTDWGSVIGQVGFGLAPNTTSFVHIYTSPGTYKYRVNACTSSGCSLSSNQPTVAIGAPPPPSPSPSPTPTPSPSPSPSPPPLQAPTPQYNYWGAGGSAPSYEGLYMLDIRFTYPGTMAGVPGFGFRFYHKRPGETNFSAVATFPNPAPIAQNCSSGVASGNWTLEYSCPYSLWFLRHTTQPSSFFPVGTYESYLVAFDASGEGPPSATFTHVALDRTTILSPIGAQASSTTPIIRWTVASGWPSNPSYYIKVYDNTSVVWTPNVSVTAGSAEGSVAYAGPALDPTKTYTTYIRSSLVSGGVNYISMNAGTQNFTVPGGGGFLPSAPASRIAASDLVTFRTALASILESLLKLVQDMQALLPNY